MIKRKDLKNKKITVMGLGLNGGGLASALFLAKEGAQVTVTDLRDAEILAPTLKELQGIPLRTVLGKHDMEDFSTADMVIKNPAVPLDSPYLKEAKIIETDISLFLRFSPNPVLAVTGSKGKSTTVSALYHILKASDPGCRLGGNITISPLSFIDDVPPDSPVILELSSWQLADLRGKGLLKPEVSLITNIMHDHQNRYNNFQEYIDDKLLIFQNQSPDKPVLLPLKEKSRGWDNLPGGKKFFFPSMDQSFEGEGLFGFRKDQGLFQLPKGEEEVLLEVGKGLKGRHIRGNMLAAGAMARLWGVPAEEIRKRLENFPGVAHRMELCRSWKEISFINDTAATIPDAAVAALESCDSPALLICGGTDKELDLEPMKGKMGKAKKIFLLQGSATDRMIPLLEQEGMDFNGPFSNLKDAFTKAVETAQPGDCVLLSPGATSFGMFKNEFDRGDQFRQLVASLKD